MTHPAQHSDDRDDFIDDQLAQVKPAWLPCVRCECGTHVQAEYDAGVVYGLHQRPDGSPCTLSGTLVSDDAQGKAAQELAAGQALMEAFMAGMKQAQDAQAYRPVDGAGKAIRRTLKQTGVL